ncbi:DNA-directed primase/polymerase protein [Protopterus annectens]|uniref:DNA-directed primase/polymerase protein n=1 Tax=Protopterus annectens TaxID=7888 RepID=UPI001CFB3882|nr:DNA-directed primase/polymerase protein [Protopterus annectens]
MKRKWEERLKHVECLAVIYQRHPLQSPYKPCLHKPSQPPSVWKLFPRQTTAFNFAKCCKEDVHVFALETKDTETGKRFYLVTTYTEFWHYYQRPRQSLTHCYEVIPAGSVCKLYFDLEFHKPSNPGVSGKQLVAKLIQHVCQKLEDFFGILCTEKDVLNLDSSTEEKFSRHLIFLLQNAAFKDNTHVGNFVKSILQPAISKLQTNRMHHLEMTEEIGVLAATVTYDFAKFGKEHHPQKEASTCSTLKRTKISDLQSTDLSFLLVKDKEGFCNLFVDLAVYTKNRNFRLYKSSKAGKIVTLKIADDNKFAPKQEKNISVEEQLFQCSLVSNVRFTDLLKIITCCSPDEADGKGQLRHCSLSSSSSESTVSGYQWSPYPEIDRFVLSLVSKDHIKGGIRRWNYFSAEQLIVYDITKYRHCENVRRPHKSNNIMIVADLKKEIWYQKCHDPVCRAAGFKSKSYPLPPEVCLDFIFTEDEDELSYSMDESGIIIEHRNTFQNLSDLLQKEGSTLNACQPENLEVDWKEIDDTLCLEGMNTDWSKETSKFCCTSETADWNEDIDDDSCVEAAEDTELCLAADDDLHKQSTAELEVPDDLMLAAAGQSEASWDTDIT